MVRPERLFAYILYACPSGCSLTLTFKSAILPILSNSLGREFESKIVKQIKVITLRSNIITFICLARPERFELPTTWFEAKYSIQLSYGRISLKPAIKTTLLFNFKIFNKNRIFLIQIAFFAPGK